MRNIISSLAPELSPEQAQLLLRRVVELHAAEFSETPRVRELLAQRGLTNLATLEHHQTGFCAGKLRPILNDAALVGQLAQLGILDRKGREHFKDHLIFPLFTPEGAIANVWVMPVKGRLSKFLPGRARTFWNVAAVRLSSQLLVAPTPLDGLALKAAGFNNVVALAPAHGAVDTSVLEKNGVQQLIVVVGDDPESPAAADALVASLKPYRPSVIALSKCDGALAFLKHNGEKALAEAIVAGINGVVAITVPGMRPQPDGFSLPIKDILYSALGLERTKRSLRVTIRAGRGEKTTAITLDFHQLRQRHEFIREMARVFGESADRIEADLRKLQDACDVRLAQPDFLLPGAPVDPVPEGDRSEAELMGKDPDLFGLVVRDCRALGIVGENDNIMLCFLAVVSRKMDDPLAVMVLSSSSAGKSTVVDKARDLSPPEEQFDTAYLSGKALYHLPTNGLKHKLVTIAEQEGAKQANYPIRILISAKALTAVVTGRDTVSGRLQAETKRVEGPAAIIVTSSDPNLDRETLSRFIVTSVDESREQTLAIREEQRKAQTAEGIAAAQAAAKIIRRHHAYHRLLVRNQVIIPSSLQICYDDDRLCSRRDFPKVLGVIKAVAFARQMQKQVKEVEGIPCIEVDKIDLAIAEPLIRRLFVSTVDELSAPSRSLLCLLHKMSLAAKAQPGIAQFNGEGRFVFTRRQVAEHSKWSKTSLHRCLKELEESEYVLRDTGTRRRPFQYFLDWNPPANSGHVPAKFQYGEGPETAAS